MRWIESLLVVALSLIHIFKQASLDDIKAARIVPDSVAEDLYEVLRAEYGTVTPVSYTHLDVYKRQVVR